MCCCCCCCCCRCSFGNDHTASYTKHALLSFSFSSPSIAVDTLHTIGTTSHRLFFLRHDGSPLIPVLKGFPHIHAALLTSVLFLSSLFLPFSLSFLLLFALRSFPSSIFINIRSRTECA